MCSNIVIRPVEDRDFSAVLALNEANVAVLAPMDENRIRYFQRTAEFFHVAEADGCLFAFLIVLRENLDYESENYRWFAAHYPRFLYIDRIVIDAAYRKSGIGSKLYQEVVRHARDTSIPLITAEIDTEPVYNAVSLRFHKTMGFKEVGTQYVCGGTIKVSLQVLEPGP